MPGRRYTVQDAPKKAKRKSKNKSRALNAFSIAEHEVPTRVKVRKSRLGDDEDTSRKRSRDSPLNSSEDDEDGVRSSKKLRRGGKDRNGNEIEGGSDGEGHEWMTGLVDEENDSELDSDEAMGESDEEAFEGFGFGGSSSNKKTTKHKSRPVDFGASEGGMDLEEESGHDGGLDSDVESEGFAAEAVDLADVLDQRDTESEEDVPDSRSRPRCRRVASEDDDSDVQLEELELSQSDLDDESYDPAKLQDLLSTLDPSKATSSSKSELENAQEMTAPSEYGVNSSQKLTIYDLLPTVTDPTLRKSLRAITEGSKQGRTSGGVPGKLDVPLAKRQQDRIDRGVAFEKSKEALSRWIDTVKHNRRADHLQFPLPDADVESAKNVSKLQPTSQSKPLTDLESTIKNILIESGMVSANGKSEEDQLQAFEELATNKMPIEEVQARRAELRRARDLLFREERKAKRIKSIKSKSYRRVHRKERERNLLRERETSEAAGAEPSEDEQERLHRQRAEERMGAKHRDSKWAKSVRGSGRAHWDEDTRAEVAEMARRGEELKRRIQGMQIHRDENSDRDSESNDEENSEGDDNDNFTKRMRDRLQLLKESEKAEKGIASLRFMQNAEKARKARNNEDIERLQRELAGENSPAEESDIGEARGRRAYGPFTDQPAVQVIPRAPLNEFEEKLGSEEDEVGGDATIVTDEQATDRRSERLQSKAPIKIASKEGFEPGNDIGPTAEIQATHQQTNLWFTNKKRSSKRTSESEILTIDTQNASQSQQPQSTKAPRTSSNSTKAKLKYPLVTIDDSGSDQEVDPTKDESKTSNPLVSDQSLIHQAFASDATHAATSFATEKSALADEEAPQDTTPADLPGWGNWVGEGLSKAKRKSNKRHSRSVKQYDQGKNKHSEGVAADQRKDRKLEKVIISEKRVPKTAKYLATQLPHTFETKAQYERSLRMPVGPEWTTKETFQAQTKPRVMIKGGAIGAMRKPLI